MNRITFNHNLPASDNRPKTGPVDRESASRWRSNAAGTNYRVEESSRLHLARIFFLVFRAEPVTTNRGRSPDAAALETMARSPSWPDHSPAFAVTTVGNER